MTDPPPDDPNAWSKNDLVRELRRLRAILRERAERPGNDPRQQATTGAIAQALAAGWTHARIARATGLSRGRYSQIPKQAAPAEVSP